MTIQQLQYVVAVDEHRHFQKAAVACFVTPAALSIMVKRLEEELGVVIFDRSRQPVIPTEMGVIVIRNAREILSGVRKMEQEVKYSTGTDIRGELRIGVIPTLAPYLLHLFVPGLLAKYPDLKIQLKELHTHTILEQLQHDLLDVGLMAVQPELQGLKVRSLFRERLLVFVSENETSLNHRFLLPGDIDVERLWLLEEEHCLRSQVMNLCSLKKKAVEHARMTFDAGSIETLMNIVEGSGGITVIPELATLQFTAARKQQVRYFAPPEPVREIGMVTYRHFVKEKLLDILQEEIQAAVAPLVQRI